MKIKVFFIALLMLFPQISYEADINLTYHWIFVNKNLLIKKNVKAVQEICRRAAKSGYNGIVIADYKLHILDRMEQRYFENIAEIRRTATQLGLELIPFVVPIGHSTGILTHDPNLAEGIPVRDALFVAHNGKAELVEEPPVELKNGNFEQVKGDWFSKWDWQENAGASILADHKVFHDGKTSMRMERIGEVDPVYGHCRIYQSLDVAPFRYYHIEVWIKTQNFENPDGVNIAILAPDGRRLSHIYLGVEKTQDWRLHHVVFNSLNYNRIRIYLGVWKGRGGTVWWDGVKLEEIGLVNVLRRPGCPLTVRGKNGVIYEEGRDFLPVKDELLNEKPGNYDIYHNPPAIQLTENSRIKEGQKLRVSFYHPVRIYRGQYTSCLSEPKVFEVLKGQLKRVNELFQPKTFFMNYDEIRVANWCEACRKRNLTPGQLLADNVKRCVEIIRKINPDAKICVWSDMFDPNHNARDNYYLVNGSLKGSWEGLPADVIIVNWNYKGRAKSLSWFARRGHKQILAGYYGADEFYTPQWLKDAKGLPGIVGVMYTALHDEYEDIEAYANAIWNRGK